MKEEIIVSRHGKDGETVQFALDNMGMFVIRTSNDGGRTSRAIRLSAQQMFLLKQCIGQL